MTTNSRSTKKGGRPPKGGGTAKPMLNVDGKRVRDTVENRRKYGLPETGPVAHIKPQLPGKTEPMPKAAQTDDKPGETEAAIKAGMKGAPVAEKPPEKAPEAVQLDFIQVVAVANMFVTNQFPDYAMLPHEQEAIGKSLDGVIAKYFPALKDAGPEVALLLAVSTYVIRVFMPKTQIQSPPVPGPQKGEFVN